MTIWYPVCVETRFNVIIPYTACHVQHKTQKLQQVDNLQQTGYHQADNESRQLVFYAVCRVKIGLLKVVSISFNNSTNKKLQ